MSRRHTWSFARSNRSKAAAFQMKYLKISDFLDNVKLADKLDTWQKKDPDYTKVPLNCPLSVSSSAQNTMPLNTKIYPITARNVGLQKLKYYSLLYDFYMVDAIVLQYIPGVSVSTPGFLTFHYEPNQTFSPLNSSSTGMISEESGFSWTSYAARQKYGVTFPVWQPQTMVIRPKKYWMRTIPSGGGESSAFTKTEWAPDPLCDYGCFYWHSDEKGSTAGDFQLYGLINIFISVKFRDFSFGRTNPNVKPTPSTLTNDEGIYLWLKNNKDFEAILNKNGLVWDKFILLPPDQQGSLMSQVIKPTTFKNVKIEL